MSTINRRDFMKAAALGAAALTTGCQFSPKHLHPFAKFGRRPNVVILNVDDMGYGDMSCHGNPAIQTPNLDKLHSQSLRFTQFHSAPMCTPTRSQLLTGVDCLRNGARWVGTENTHLRTDLPIMPEIFRDSGYRTAMFGKWHVGDNYPRRPMDRGFEEVVTFPQQEVGTVNDYWGNDYFSDTYEHNGRRQAYKGFCTDVWFDLAMNWMDGRAAQEEPFFCYIPTNVVHGPYYAAQQYRDRVKIPNLSKEVQTFFGMLLNLDDNLGRLEQFLEQKGLKENTIFIFMTDNGATGGYHTYNAGMRGLKTQMWEGGHRVPCFVRWPKGGLSKPQDIGGLVQAQDLLPTLIDLCGLQKPATAKFDGISMAGALRGQNELPDRMLVVQFQRSIKIVKWDACIMWGPWRLLNARDIDPMDSPEKKKEIEARRKSGEIKLELYNVADDPHQDRNVYDANPDVIEKMKAFYEQWWAKTQPELNIPKPIIIGNDAENPSFLSAPSWADEYFTQMSDVLEGRKINGFWNVLVDRAGDYEITLRRWPTEADTAIAGSATIKYDDPYVYGPEKVGKALPITEARLTIADIDQRVAVKPDDKGAVFNIKLKKGDTQLQTFFYNEKGKELCGAYYVYVRRK